MGKGSNQGRKSALLVGIDKYSCDKLPDLRGCLTDVATTEMFLTKVAGISSITKLTSPPDPSNDLLPTLDNIKSEFGTLSRNAQPGDFIYIHYSGHGCRMATAFSHIKGDNVLFDECLVLPHSDGRLDHIRDVEVTCLLKQIADKGATVTFVLDCCHSGGATRSDDGVRGSTEIPKMCFFDLKRKPIQSVEDLRDAWGLPRDDGDDASRGGRVVPHWMTASKGINFFAACQPQQKAQEVPRGARVRKGLFTDCLASVVNAQNRVADHLSCDIVSNLVAHTLETHMLYDKSEKQQAVFGGHANRLFFGVESVVQPAVVVTSVESLSSEGKFKVGLTAGVANGVCKHDIFAIYPSDRRPTNFAEYIASLATCSVTAMEDFTCEAHTKSKINTADLKIGCVAINLRRILHDQVLQPKGVWVSAANDSTEPPSPVVQKVRDCISRGSKPVELKDAGEAFFKVLVQENGSFTISFTPNKAEVKVEVTGKPEEVLFRLDHLTVFYNLFDLAKNNAAQQGLTITQLDCPHSLAKDLRRLPEDSIDILTGKVLVIEVRNSSYRGLYVEILDLEPSWRVTRTYPKLEEDSPILVSPNTATRFFIRVSLSETVRNVVQPDTFDRYVVLATSRSGLNFIRNILPTLGESRSGAPPLLVPDGGDGRRAGKGVAQPGWFVQQLDVRVVDEE
ncbi:caspase [Apiospora kogelbergensis]|uniref:Caspase n=1 Tax=Apiospora kogelbergensis TaxID=1337665 RepID=A0AAW0R2S2_9PEZI